MKPSVTSCLSMSLAAALLLAACEEEHASPPLVAAQPQPSGPASAQGAAAPAQVQWQKSSDALAKAMSGMTRGARTPVATIPWQTLAQALPQAIPGWTAEEQAKGQTAKMMGIDVSTASIALVALTMKARVDIVDTAMNPWIAMPFNLARAVLMDSATERVGAVTLGGHPATERFDKPTNVAEVIAMVSDRILVTVRVSGARSEQTALSVAQMINYPLLAAALPR